MRFTQEELDRANRVDLEQLLARLGEPLLPAGREKRLQNDHSITIRGNRWYDHAEERGGLAISFMRSYYQKSFVEAVNFLLHEEGVVPVREIEQAERELPPFVLPEANADNRRLYGYLVKERKIAPRIVTAFVRENLLYESREEKDGKVYRNAVFVGKDAEGTARHGHKRGLTSYGNSYRGNIEGGDPAYSFQYRGAGKRVYLFEAPIDLMSYLTLHETDWREQSYIALMGVSGRAMLRFLEERPDVEEVVFCLDNDEAGDKAIGRLWAQVEATGRSYRIWCEQPQEKDWNEELKASCARQETAEQEQGPRLALA